MFGSKMMRAAVATTIGLLAMGTLALTSVTSSAGANQAPMVHSSFSMTLTSQGKQLRTTGPGLDSTYGWNQLTGPTTIDGQASSAEWLATVKPATIVYLSCDPVTLARDSADLVKAGYELKSLKPYDFYPQTSHVECNARFILR